MTSRIYFGDNLDVLRTLADGSINLIYIDPPFNTGKQQGKTQIKTVRSDGGDRVGFKGRTYTTIKEGTRFYADMFDDYLGFLEPRLREAYRVLAPDGTLYFHIDYREVHYCKVLLDGIFGRASFLNEIIWAYDYGARTTKRWPAKHDNILVYVKDPDRYTFNADEIERIPYMAPGLVGPEKAARGKLPTDTWWHTIVPTNGKEKTGYPTQKPLGILRRIIQASSRPGDTVLDFFAGSGTTGIACVEHNRQFVLVDSNLQAIEVMRHRFADVADVAWIDAGSLAPMIEAATSIRVAAESPRSEDAQRLMDELGTTLTAITGASGTASFDVRDVEGERAIFAVARDEHGIAIGCGALRPLVPGIAEVKRMYARSESGGVGTAVLGFLEAVAPTLGYTTLWLETRTVNTRAIAFYERHGYERIPRYGKYAGNDAAICLGKRLDPHANIPV